MRYKVHWLIIILLLQSFHAAYGQGPERDSCKIWIEQLDELFNSGNLLGVIALSIRIKESCNVEEGKDTMYIKYWNAIGSINLVTKNYKDAAVNLEKARKLIEDLSWYISEDNVAVQANLSTAWYYLGEFAKGEACANQALELAPKVFSKKNIVIGQALYLKGQFLFLKGNFKESLAFFSKAQTCKEGVDESAFKLFETAILGSLAAAHWRIGEFDKAADYFEKSIRFAKYTHHPQYFVFLSNAGVFYLDIGQVKKAYEFLNEAVTEGEQTLRQNELFYGISLNNLATAYRYLGQYSKAEEVMIQVNNIFDQLTPDNHFYKGIYFNNMGFLYMETMQFDKAIPLQERALEEYEKAIGENHQEYARSLLNLANSYEQIGQLDMASDLAARAQKIVTGNESSLSPVNLAFLLEIIGQIQEREGDFDAAIASNQKMLKLWKKAQGKKGYQYTQSLMKVGSVYLSAGKYSPAKRYLEKARKNLLQIANKDHPLYGIVLGDLAEYYSQKNDFLNAEQCYLDALSNIEAFAGKYNLGYKTILINLGKMYDSRGDYKKAFAQFQLADSILHDQIVRNFEILSEIDKEQFILSLQRDFECFKAFAYRHPGIPGVLSMIWEDELALQGLLLYSTREVRNAIYHSGDPTLQAKYAEWRDLKELLYQQVSLGRGSEFSKLALDSLARVANNLESDLVRMSADFRKNRERTTWQELHSRLQKASSSAIITYIHFRPNEGTNETVYAALISRGKYADPVLVPLCQKGDLQKNLTATGFLGEKHDKIYSRANRSTGKTLYNLIWEPLDTFLAKIDTIYYTPSGLLHKVSFPAICLPDTTLLTDRYQRLEYAGNSGNVGLGKLQSGQFTSPACIMGSIDYNAELEAISKTTPPGKVNIAVDTIPRQSQSISCSWETQGVFPLLPDQQEVNSLEEKCKYAGLFTQTLTGAEATEEKLRDISSGLLHISTHGFFCDPAEEPLSSKTPLLSEASMFYSGLLMAGGNRTIAGKPPYAGYEDGIAYANEISLYELASIKLAVLSACETGLGEVRGSEGVYGLQRGFKKAGVQNLLMTLWQIPAEEGTREFMESFYSNWFSGMDIRDAFYLTQRKMREKYKDGSSYYWAGWVLID